VEVRVVAVIPRLDYNLVRAVHKAARDVAHIEKTLFPHLESQVAPVDYAAVVVEPENVPVASAILKMERDVECRVVNHSTWSDVEILRDVDKSLARITSVPARPFGRE
jgi:maleate cis-trans isomerase